MDRLDDDDDWLDPNHSGGLWEHQSHPLTAGRLSRILSSLPDDLVVELERYSGEGNIDKITPMHVDLRGHGGVPEAVVIFGQCRDHNLMSLEGFVVRSRHRFGRSMVVRSLERPSAHRSPDRSRPMW